MMLWSGWSALLAVALTAQSPSDQGFIRFADVSDESGVKLPNLSGSHEKTFIVEVNGNGAAFFDFDEDSDMDLLVVNGSTLEELPRGGTLMAALFQNVGGGAFRDVTRSAGLSATGWGMGVCVADIDNDGLDDVYVTAYGPNVLYRNRGDGTFEETSTHAGVDNDGYGTGCSFGDYDRDGDVDLYAARYLTFDPVAAEDRGKTPDCQFMGVSVFCGPRHFQGEPDALYRNNGDGTFADMTTAAGLDGPPYYGFGVVSGDLDDDGWLDIYVANDSRPNFLFKNLGDGTFSEEALSAGTALSQEGRQQAGMGVDIGDYDNDGWLDVFVTNFSHETNALYRGGPDLIFADVSFSMGLGGASLASLGWGTGMVDLDNDGWLDIFVANGHIYKEVDTHPQFGTEYAQSKQVFRNDFGRRFLDVSEQAGDAIVQKSSSRGVAFGDIDDDGRLDVLIVNLDARPTLLRNETAGGNRSIALRLIGTTSNRGAVGARVTLHSGEQVRVAETKSGGSYLSHNDSRLHFGLGSSEQVDRVEIRWSSGEHETLSSLRAGSILTIVEGKGIVRSQGRD